MDGGKRNDIAIDIEALLNMIKAPMIGECCIYKVLGEICQLNKDAYTPKVVSIGPFHYQDPILQKIESQKQLYLKCFLQRPKTDLNSLVSLLEELELKVRCCYSEDIDFLKQNFVKMILLDARFILELFCQVYHEDCIMGGLSSKRWLMAYLKVDLCLLENQLPFFVLDDLYNLAFPNRPSDDLSTFLHLTFNVFASWNKQNLDPKFVTIHHFTDLLRTFHLQPFDSRPMREGKIPTHVYTITELREAGVKFEANRNSQCLLDLNFSGGVLEIPHLQVEDRTETWFRNIMALEQCHYPLQQYFTDYIVVLDRLVNKESDVEVLVRKGIFENMLGDNNDVVKLVNSLGKNIFHAKLNSKFQVICKKLNAFYKNPWHTTKATLRRDYCKTPWQTAASIAAILILIFTFIQTICSIFQVVN